MYEVTASGTCVGENVIVHRDRIGSLEVLHVGDAIDHENSVLGELDHLFQVISGVFDRLNDDGLLFVIAAQIYLFIS